MLNEKSAIENRVWLSSFVLLIIVFFSFSAQAACTTPAGIAGEMYYNTTDEVMVYCDNTNWIDMGPTPGAGGGGCTSPTGSAGTMEYNSTTKAMVYCDGAAWNPMGPEITNPGTGNLVAHWEFEETSGTTVDDSTGNADNDGTLQGSATWSTTAAVGSGSILLDQATDDYIGIANGDAVGAVSAEATYSGTAPNQTITVSGWARPTGFTSGAWEPVAGNLAGIHYMSWEDDIINSGTLRAMTRNFDAGTANFFYESNGAITIDEWMHFAFMVEDGVGYKIYIDGVLDKEISDADVNIGHWGCAGTDECNIGKFRATDSGSFDGYLDDFRVYDGELTAANISYLYSLSNTSCTSPTGVEGEMQYNSTATAMQYCNGSRWVIIGK